MKILMMLCLVFLQVSCTKKKAMEVDHKSIEPGSQVYFKGKPLKLHAGEIKVGDNFLNKIKDTDIGFVFKDKVTIISIVPSIDTPVCEEQTHILGETKDLKKGIDRVTISRDLPMAQKRFAKEAQLENISYISDYKTSSFGKNTGLLIEKTALLARGVVVLDSKGEVRYLQIVSEITMLPDMGKAIQFANSLL